MKKKNHFYVIGGQYESGSYGGAPTLIGAKRLANKHSAAHCLLSGDKISIHLKTVEEIRSH